MEERKKRGSGEDLGREETGAKKLQVTQNDLERPCNGNLHLKLLIPSIAAGAIIGKGGETIADIQKTVGARIKMSKANDFYPGTNERVCLVTGDKEAVTEVMGFLTEKVKEKPDPNSKTAIDFDSKVTAERDKQIKVIVPNSTAGMIIGKGGSYIKHLKETSGSFIQLSQKARDNTLPERVVTIIGEEESNEIALEMILTKIQEDPQSGSCLNISYSEMAGPVANCNPTGSPFANGAQPPSSSNGGDCEYHTQLGGYNLYVPALSSLVNLKLNFSNSVPPTDPRISNPTLPHLNSAFRRGGYTEKDSDELTRALGVLALHGALQMATHPDYRTEHNDTLPPHPNSQGPYGPTGLVTAAPGADRPSTYRASSPPGLPGLPLGPSLPLPVNNNSFGLATAGNPLPPMGPGLEEAMAKIDIEVNESLVGAVLGPAGRHIIEIQQYSGANIQISKKGTYSPGTRNRIVTVTGPQNCVNTAEFLIEKRVQDEEGKRQMNNGGRPVERQAPIQGPGALLLQ